MPCASYWVVDPDEPSVTAWDLRGGTYVEAGHATGAETVALALPYPVAIPPADLVT